MHPDGLGLRLSALDCVVHQVEEPENFVKEKYAREHEKLSPWSLASLAKSPYEKEGMLGGASGHAFFPASEFAVLRTMLESRGPLHWPPYLLFSGNHTQPRWRFVNHRRLKNLLITMEWLPDVSDQDGAVPGARSAVLGAVSGILGAVPGVPVDVSGVMASVMAGVPALKMPDTALKMPSLPGLPFRAPLSFGRSKEDKDSNELLEPVDLEALTDVQRERLTRLVQLYQVMNPDETC